MEANNTGLIIYVALAVIAVIFLFVQPIISHINKRKLPK